MPRRCHLWNPGGALTQEFIPAKGEGAWSVDVLVVTLQDVDASKKTKSIFSKKYNRLGPLTT